jgi:hypothetical protein
LIPAVAAPPSSVGAAWFDKLTMADREIDGDAALGRGYSLARIPG